MTSTPATGPVGTLIRFGGSRAPANVLLQVSFDDTVTGTIHANAAGAFTGSLTVPEATYGGHSVNVGTTDGFFGGESNFAVTASIVLTPATGPPSSGVLVQGHGFPSKSGIGLRFSGQTAGDGTSSADGSFVASVLVPLIGGGDYLIVAKATAGDVAAMASFRVVEQVALGVQTSVGSLHFPGEVVDFFVLVSSKGASTDATITATLWYPNGTSLSMTTTAVATGLYRATWTLPGTAPSGTYAFVAEAAVSQTFLTGGGAGLATFLVSPTLATQNAAITSIQGSVASIKTDTGQLRLDLAQVHAQITSVEGDLATVSTDIGTLTANLAALDGKVTGIQGSIATVQTSLGTVQTSLTSLDAKITSIQGGIATIQTNLGTTTARVSDLQTTGGAVTMSAASVAAIFAVIASVAAVLAWRSARRPKET